jgi:hypothetical protein
MNGVESENCEELLVRGRQSVEGYGVEIGIDN